MEASIAAREEAALAETTFAKAAVNVLFCAGEDEGSIFIAVKCISLGFRRGNGLFWWGQIANLKLVFRD